MGGVRWAERLTGWLSFDQTDFNQALLEGRRDGLELSAELTLEIDDIDQFVAASTRSARVSAGVIDSRRLGGRLPVHRGRFELLVPSSPLFDQLHLRMRYDLEFQDPDGRDLRLIGFKVVENDPGYDSWSDTTTLFVRIYTAITASFDHDTPGQLLATGVIRISPLGVLRELASFRGTEGSPLSQIRDVARFGRCFAGGLARTYLGKPIPDGQPSFPHDRPPPPWIVERRESGWHSVPGRTEAADGRHHLERNIVHFTVPDLTFPLNLHRIRKAGEATRGEPVLLVHGSGVRAEMFYGQPVGVTIVDELLDHGYDVWVESWRSSIDFPANSYSLDQAARLDHPAAVAKVLELSGADSLRAIVHCQGSISFLMSMTAGFIPEGSLSHVVSSAISLFFDVPGATWLKQRMMLPLASMLGSGADPQWGIRAQTAAGAGLAWISRRAGRPCGNGPCQIANYLFGSGWDVLLRHENLDDAVHAWSARELGYVPFTLISQVSESCRHGHIVPSAGAAPGTPPSYLLGMPHPSTRFTFLAGDHNRMFKPSGQQQACKFVRQCGLEADFALLPGYGHIDTFWGKDAARDVFPLILAGLRNEDRRAGAMAATGNGEVKLNAPPGLAAFRRGDRRPALRFSPPPVTRSRVSSRAM